MKDKNIRSLAKAVTWRFLATLTTITLVYIATRELALSIGVGAIEVITKLLLYYAHERVWNVVQWGKKASYEDV